MASPRWVDLSHPIERGMVTYRGLPGPVICDYLSREASRELYEPGTEFQIGKIEMVANTGTYIDAPFHRFESGKDLSELALERLVDIPGRVVRVDHRNQLAIDRSAFAGLGIRGGAVLVHTGWSKHWKTPAYFEGHPFLTLDAAQFLRDCGVTLVGIDSHNIDDTRGRTRPVHTVLLEAEIVIAEHLCGLDQLPGSGFSFTAVPPKFRGVGTFPVRAFAKIG